MRESENRRVKAIAEPRVLFDPADWISAHGDVLFRYARQRLTSVEEAEDVVQETFLAALDGLTRFENRSAGRTWLIAILRRKISDHYRKTARSEGSGSSRGEKTLDFFDKRGHWIDPPSPWPGAEKRLENGELGAVLDGCLEALPPHLADPFVLREREGMTPDEVRTITGLSEGNLRVRLHRARLLLRACLEKNAFGL